MLSYLHIPELGKDPAATASDMVFLASTLGIMLKTDLQTGNYLAQILLGTISVSLLPVLFYIIAIITALITGSPGEPLHCWFPLPCNW